MAGTVADFHNTAKVANLLFLFFNKIKVIFGIKMVLFKYGLIYLFKQLSYLNVPALPDPQR